MSFTSTNSGLNTVIIGMPENQYKTIPSLNWSRSVRMYCIRSVKKDKYISN